MINQTAYEALPYAYIGGGLVCFSGLDSQLKLLPGLVLMGAGLLVLVWRHAARIHQRKQERISKQCRDLRHRQDEAALRS